MDETLEKWEELIDGQAVVFNRCPSLNHNAITLNLCCVFGDYLRGKKEIRPFQHFDAWLTEKDHFIPDFAIVRDRDKIKRTHVKGAPDFVIEILSPGTAKRDRGYKKDVYERCGVREYWIVSPEGLYVEQYVLENGAFVLRDVYQHYRAYELEDLTEKEKRKLSRKSAPQFSMTLQSLWKKCFTTGERKGAAKSYGKRKIQPRCPGL